MRVPPHCQAMFLTIFHLEEHQEVIEPIADAVLSVQDPLLRILVPGQARVMKHRG